MKKRISIMRNMNLLDMSGRGKRIKKNMAVVLENDRIRTILDMKSPDLRAYAGHETIDLEGCYLAPGLIDLHVHCTNPFIDPQEACRLGNLITVKKQVENNLRACIEGGVTTVRDMGSPPGITRFMNMIEREKLTGPRIIPSFSMITCPGGYPDMVPSFGPILRFIMQGDFAGRILDPEQAVRLVQSLEKHGAQWIKTVYQEESYLFGNPALSVLSRETHAAIAQTARSVNRKMAIHALSIAGIERALEIGADTVEHLPLQKLTPALAKKLAAGGVTMVPTLVAPGLYLERMLPLLRDIIENGRSRLVPRAREHTLSIIGRILAGEKGEDMIDYPFLRRTYETMVKNLQLLDKSGVHIGFGTDAGGTDTCLFGLPWIEMQLMSDAGFDNYRILEKATKDNAATLNLDHDLGTIEEGKIADMVLFAGNPIEDVRNVGLVKKVWKDGKQLL